MKTKLIKLQDKFILVSDEEIKDGFCYNPITGEIINLSIKGVMSFDEIVNKCKKIIAGIPELPSIDFSLLSEEDCKRIGFVDVEKLAEKENINTKAAAWIYNQLSESPSEDNEFCAEVATDFWIGGFKAAQSLNDKKFSLEDMRKAYLNNGPIQDEDKGFNEFTQSLQQTSWDVEVNELNQIIKIL